VPSPDTIGIVTVLYESDSVLPGFIASLAKQTDASYRVYFIDNSPADSSLRLARSLAASAGIDAVFRFGHGNVGIASGNNLGIEMALADRCGYILLANNDVEFDAGTLSGLLHALRANQAMAVTPKFYYHGTDRVLWYAGGSINRWTMRVTHNGMHRKDHGQFDHLTKARFAPACFALLRAEVFSLLGKMDENYFVYYEDTDFAWRMNQRKMAFDFAPQIVVSHKVSTLTGGPQSLFTLYYTNRNRIYFIRKNLHGLNKAFALTYVLMTRLPNLLFLPATKSRRAWRGIFDGLRMRVGPIRDTLK
jgi:GT2 family glycosyltransferase